MKLLFICTYNRWRSLTAEKLFHDRQGWQVKSAGIASTARVKVSAKLLKWADVIFVMEQRHSEYLKENFGHLTANKKIINLDIPSGYRSNDPELIKILEERVTL